MNDSEGSRSRKDDSKWTGLCGKGRPTLSVSKCIAVHYFPSRIKALRRATTGLNAGNQEIERSFLELYHLRAVPNSYIALISTSARRRLPAKHPPADDEVLPSIQNPILLNLWLTPVYPPPIIIHVVIRDLYKRDADVIVEDPLQGRAEAATLHVHVRNANHERQLRAGPEE